MTETTQTSLLTIVQAWKPKLQPEFRGFHCGSCQDFLYNGAWHHLLNTNGYLVPVHLCGYCDENLRNGLGIDIENSPSQFDRNSFHPTFSAGAEAILDTISSQWSTTASLSFHKFSCDKCKLTLENARGWHVWQNRSGILIEYHFCRVCWIQIAK